MFDQTFLFDFQKIQFFLYSKYVIIPKDSLLIFSLFLGMQIERSLLKFDYETAFDAKSISFLAVFNDPL